MPLTDTPQRLESIWIQRDSANQYYEQINISGSNLIIYHNESGSITADKISEFLANYSPTSSLTASYATTALTASYISGSAFGIVPSASWSETAISASWAPSAVDALSSSWASHSLCSDKVYINETGSNEICDLLFVSGPIGCTNIFRDTDKGLTYNPLTNALMVSGSVISPSFVGTASFAISASRAINSFSSSYALSSSYAPIEPAASASIVIQLGTKQPNLITGSTYPITASWAEFSNSSSYAITCSYYSYYNVTQSLTYVVSASWASSSISASYAPWQPAASASIVIQLGTKQPNLVTGDTYNITSSWSQKSISASYAPWEPNASASIIYQLSGKQPTLSGTDNYLPKWWNNQLTYTSSIYDGKNATGPFIGIFTSSVENSAGWEKVIGVHGISMSRFYLDTNIVRNILAVHNTGYYGGLTGSYIGTETNHPFYFITNNSVKMTLSASNLGIGTISPTQATLQIAGNVYATSFTGSLFGTSSQAINSFSSSYALSASYAPWEPAASASIVIQLGTKQPNLITGSIYPITSSWSIRSLTSNTTTQSLFAISASWASSSISASYAPWEPNASASIVIQLGTKQPLLITGSTYPITASWSQKCISASYAPWEPAASASIVIQLGTKQPNLITGSTYPITSSWSQKAITSSYSLKALDLDKTAYNISVTYASRSMWATSASYASSSLSASYAPWEPAASASIVVQLGTKQPLLISGSTYPITSSWSQKSISASYAPVNPGTGTDNYVPKWSSNQLTETSSIYDDNTSVKVMYNRGTSDVYALDVTPTSSLNVHIARFGIKGISNGFTITQPSAGTLLYTFLIGSTYFGNYINLGNQGYITWNGGVTDTFNLIGLSGKNLSLGSNGVYDRLFLSGSGNVGINTTAPTLAKLHVNGNVYATSYTGSLFGTSSHAISASYVSGTVIGRTTLLPSYTTLTGYDPNPAVNDYTMYPHIASYCGSTFVSGSILITTPIPRNSGEMFRIRVHGYLYETSKNIDSTFVGYCYGWMVGPDGLSGSLINYGLTNNGTDTLVKRIGITSGSNGRLAIALGDTGSINYYYRLAVDLETTYGEIAYDPFSGWSITATTASNYGMTSSYVLSPGTQMTTASIAVYAINSNPGTGTNNYLPKWSSNQLTATSSIYDNNTNVGIGTNNPLYKLDIVGTGDTTTWTRMYNATNGASTRTGYCVITDDDSGLYMEKYSRTFGVASMQNHAMVFTNGYTASLCFGTIGTERMRITPSGYVGIGTTSPGAPFVVASTPSSTSGSIYCSATTTGGPNLQLHSLDTGGRKWTLLSAASANSEGAGAFSILDSTAGERRLTIDTNGYVGIGTITPYDKLSVSGSARIQNSHTTGVSLTLAGSGSNFQFGHNGTSTGYVYNSGGGMEIRQSNGVSSSLFVGATGLVGIGTTSPNNTLQVNTTNPFVGTSIVNSILGLANLVIVSTTSQSADVGPILGLGGMRDDASTNPGVFGGIRGAKENSVASNNNGYLGFYTLQSGVAFAERMRITSTGNVGVGTSTPTSGTLQVNGNVYATSYTGSFSGSVFSNPTFTGKSDNYIPKWSGNTLTGTSLIYEDGTDVGINTTDPLYTLHVVGTGYFTSQVTVQSLVETSTLQSKYDIIPLTNQLDKVMKLNPVSFKFKNDTKQNIGLISEEVYQVYPEFTTDKADAVSYGKITSVLIQCIKELKSTIDSQQKQINELLKR